MKILKSCPTVFILCNKFIGDSQPAMIQKRNSCILTHWLLQQGYVGLPLLLRSISLSRHLASSFNVLPHLVIGRVYLVVLDSVLLTSVSNQTQSWCPLSCGVICLLLCGSSGVKVGGPFFMYLPSFSSLWAPFCRLRKPPGAHAGPLLHASREGADGRACVLTESCPGLALLQSGPFWCWCFLLMCWPPWRWYMWVCVFWGTASSSTSLWPPLLLRTSTSILEGSGILGLSSDKHF